MILLQLSLVISYVFSIFAQQTIVFTQPEQVHLAYGDKYNDIVVTWSTFNETPESVVEYLLDDGASYNFTHSVKGTAVLFTDGGIFKRKQYIHKATIKDLTPNTGYMYHCGSEAGGWSEIFFFEIPPPEEEWMPSFVVYGDMGNINARSLPRLQREVEQGMYDAVLHVGDFAYDFDTDEGLVGDQFMRQIQPIAAYLPYMTCPGNHESTYNFSHYRNRFNMPNNPDNMFYSMNLGPVHLISLSSEYYYYYDSDQGDPMIQYNWLIRDLEEATRPENREKRPWIIVMAHRPFYCSTTDGDDCNYRTTKTRVGVPGVVPGLEALLLNYTVDLEIWAHEHIYERFWPVYDYKVYNGSYDFPYVNPGAPAQFITGSAGCQENTDRFIDQPGNWSAFRSTDYGYTRLKVYNRTHLYLEQVSDNLDGAIVDSFWVIRDVHGPYQASFV